MPLRILSVAYPFAPVRPDAVGGAEQVLATLDAALVAAGHGSTVMAAPGSCTAGELLALPGVCGELTAQARAQVHRQLLPLLAAELASGRHDLVHFHGVDVGAYLPQSLGPAVITLHLAPRCYPEWLLRAPPAGVALVPVSRTQAASAPQARLEAPILNGVSVPAPGRHARRRFALCLGRICPEKNQAAALDAARAAGMPLLLAGSVYPYSEHRDYFAREIAPRLDRLRRWIGPVHGRRKQRLLAAARCLLVPSRAEETSSLVAMEALACATPVIAWRSGALPEVVDHGATGILVDDCAAMAAALHRIERIDPRRCRQVALERYDARRMCAEYLTLYERLAARTRRA